MGSLMNKDYYSIAALLGQVGDVEIDIHIGLEVVGRRHFVPFATLLVERNSPAFGRLRYLSNLKTVTK